MLYLRFNWKKITRRFECAMDTASIDLIVIHGCHCLHFITLVLIKKKKTIFLIPCTHRMNKWKIENHNLKLLLSAYLFTSGKRIYNNIPIAIWSVQHVLNSFSFHNFVFSFSFLFFSHFFSFTKGISIKSSLYLRAYRMEFQIEFSFVHSELINSACVIPISTTTTTTLFLLSQSLFVIFSSKLVCIKSISMCVRASVCVCVCEHLSV